MVGSAADAEDVVQEPWLPWADIGDSARGEVRDPRAYLVRMVTRQALNRLRTLARQREDYVGEWLPEPLLTSPDVAEDVELAENVSIAMLTVLETLGPVVRGVFVLHEVFDVPYDQIAEAVGKSSAAVRQIAHRARRQVWCIRETRRQLYTYNDSMPITDLSGAGASMALLSGTRVLVTGGTSGLGRAMAQALVHAGARVVVTSRGQERAQAAAVELGAGALGVELDVRDPRSVLAAVETVYELLDGLDVLVNNAGIGMRTVNPRFMTEPQPFWEVAPAGFRDVLETKATGTFLVAREVVPRMLRTGGGRMVTISMSEPTMTRRGFIPYGPSGAAVEALARVMAADLADTPVTANILLPGGATATGMIPDEMRHELRGNLLDPSIMGPPIVWLASPDAAGVHDERIVAGDFDDWLTARKNGKP